MGIITVTELFERVDEFERVLEELYANLGHASTRKGVRLLTEYICQRRRRTLKALTRLPEKQMSYISRITLRYDPQGGRTWHCFDGVALPPDVTAVQVLDTAIEFDEHLISFYKQVLQQPVNQTVKELFESLIRREQNDKTELNKIKATDHF